MEQDGARFKREGDAVMILVETMGWIRVGPAEAVMEEMCRFLAAEDFGECR